MEEFGPAGFLPATVVYGEILERAQARGGLGGFPNVCDIRSTRTSVPHRGGSENTAGKSEPPVGLTCSRGRRLWQSVTAPVGASRLF